MSTRLSSVVPRVVVGSVLTAAMFIACAAPSRAERPAPAVETAAPSPAAEQGAQVIDHQVPRRDYVGPQPAKFSWTAAKDADHYAIGIWNEVDRLIWRKDDIKGTSVERPADLDFESGTYFWTVSGLRGDQEVAKSGLSAFVVE